MICRATTCAIKILGLGRRRCSPRTRCATTVYLGVLHNLVSVNSLNPGVCVTWSKMFENCMKSVSNLLGKVVCMYFVVGAADVLHQSTDHELHADDISE